MTVFGIPEIQIKVKMKQVYILFVCIALVAYVSAAPQEAANPDPANPSNPSNPAAPGTQPNPIAGIINFFNGFQQNFNTVTNNAQTWFNSVGSTVQAAITNVNPLNLVQGNNAQDPPVAPVAGQVIQVAQISQVADVATNEVQKKVILDKETTAWVASTVLRRSK